MISKLFKLVHNNDRIPVIAINLSTENANEQALLNLAGFGPTAKAQSRFVLVSSLDTGKERLEFDPNKWKSLTLTLGHKHILQNFNDMESGSTIEISTILNHP